MTAQHSTAWYLYGPHDIPHTVSGWFLYCAKLHNAQEYIKTIAKYVRHLLANVRILRSSTGETQPCFDVAIERCSVLLPPTVSHACVVSFFPSDDNDQDAPRLIKSDQVTTNRNG